MTPILPFINDTRENIEGLLDYCLQADVKGILLFDVGVTLREGDREFFYQLWIVIFPAFGKNMSILTEMPMIFPVLTQKSL